MQLHLFYIAEFTTDIHHVHGKYNVVADTLSRIETAELQDIDNWQKTKQLLPKSQLTVPLSPVYPSKTSL